MFKTKPMTGQYEL